MASTAKEDMGQSSSAASDGNLSQPAQAGLPEAADDSQCPICLGPMKRPAYVTYCMHKFCLRCIWQWARARANCPVCRQPMEQLLHSVRGDSDYKECAIGPAARLHRRVATERGLQPIAAVMLRMRQAVHDQQRLARPMDTQSARSRPMDIESVRRRLMDTESARSRPMDIESVRRRPMDIESVRRRLMDTESARTRPMDTESARSRPTDIESARRRPMDIESARSRPMDIESAQTQEAAPGPSNALSQQAPAASHQMTPLREGERPAGPASPLEPQNGTE